MNIFEESDYRKIIKTIVGERKQVNSQINFQSLADAMRVQKSYLSKVLAGKGDFNFDQLFLACKFLELDSSQFLYLENLLQLSRTVLPERRQELQKKIQKLQGHSLKTQKHIVVRSVRSDEEALRDYYLNPWLQIVHVSLYIDRYQKDPQLLSKDLGISTSTLSTLLNQLEKMQIIERKQNQVRVAAHDLHLPKDSPWYTSWRTHLKLLATQKMQSLSTDKAFNFSVVFSADEPTRTKIHSAFLAFLKTVEREAKTAPSKNTYQLSFDLFPWTSI